MNDEVSDSKQPLLDPNSIPISPPLPLSTEPHLQLPIDNDNDHDTNNKTMNNNVTNYGYNNQMNSNSYEFNSNVVGDSGMNNDGNSSTPLSPPSFISGGGSSLNSSSSQTGSLHQRLNFNVISSKVKEFKDTRLQNTRDWMLFVGKRDKYGVPSISSATDRVKENIIYFQTNYLILFFIFATYVIFTKPLFLLLLVLLALIHIYLNYINPELPDIQKKIGVGLQIILSVYFLLSAGSDIVWLIGATLSIVLLHAAFHVPQSTDDSQVSFGNSSV